MARQGPFSLSAIERWRSPFKAFSELQELTILVMDLLRLSTFCGSSSEIGRLESLVRRQV